MNNENITMTQRENNCYKVLFKVRGNLAMIHTLMQHGMHINMDAKCEYACAYFDNVIDYNDFQEKLAHISHPVYA